VLSRRARGMVSELENVAATQERAWKARKQGGRAPYRERPARAVGEGRRPAGGKSQRSAGGWQQGVDSWSLVAGAWLESPTFALCARSLFG
jgi:hypothetical protein